MPLIPLDSLDDPRLASYRNLTDRQLEVRGDRFVVEGLRRVRRLLEAGFTVESVLAARGRVQAVAPHVPEHAPLYVLGEDQMARVVGYHIHTGVVACAFRKPWPTVDAMAAGAIAPPTWLVCPQIKNTENLGALIRIGAAFGVAGLLLGETCCDPFCRRSIRVSMGSVFRLPIRKSDALRADLERLRERWGVTLMATVLEEGAQPLHTVSRSAGAGVAILMGHEDTGLPADLVAMCDRRVTIPMRMGTDSLNVAIAAAVFLYHFMRPKLATLPEAADQTESD